MENHTFFATAPKGMSDLLADELRSLGADQVAETRAGAQFQGSLEMAYRACLWSRLANRILLPLGTFLAASPEALYAGVRNIDWAAHMRVDQTLAVDTNVSASAITHSHYAALKIKDAIVDGFAEVYGTRPDVDVDRPDIRINCYIHKDEASLYLDLSGTSLHQRNYRLGAGPAPLKENLAAALLLRAKWPEIAASQGAFVDPLCGSGTLVIEAAMMAGDRAPGLQRDYFGFLGWQQHDPDVWSRLMAEAQRRASEGLARLPVLLGFDIDRGVLEQARDNARHAGLADHISFAYQDIMGFRHDLPSRGLVVTNPPYGRRLAETDELPALYRGLGQMMKKNLVGWKAAVFTEDQALGKHLGLRAGKLHSLYNGAIACKLIHFNIEPGQFFRDARLPRRLDPAALSSQAEMFANRLQKNIKQLGRWVKKSGVSCYRLYDADLPDYAAAIDLYEGCASPERWICIQEYAAPATIDSDKALQRTRELVTVVQQQLQVDDDHLFYKTRARQRGDAQYERLAHEQHFHPVLEGQGRLLVNFEDYLDTGLFLDHRPLRLRLFDEARGKHFLNLFAYTGAATVHAALGGAATTTTVDMSQTYLDWARRNLALNDIKGRAHQLIHADCLQWLAQAPGPAAYDLIFLDPPTFSNSKRMASSFDVQQDHELIIRQAMQRLRPGGTLYFSTNLRNFKLEPALAEQFAVRNISAETVPHDFKRRQNIHHCWAISWPSTD